MRARRLAAAATHIHIFYLFRFRLPKGEDERRRGVIESERKGQRGRGRGREEEERQGPIIFIARYFPIRSRVGSFPEKLRSIEGGGRSDRDGREEQTTDPLPLFLSFSPLPLLCFIEMNGK